MKRLWLLVLLLCIATWGCSGGGGTPLPDTSPPTPTPGAPTPTPTPRPAIAIVIPDGHATVEGGPSSSGIVRSTPMTQQYLYPKDQLTSLPIGSQIVGIRFRAKGNRVAGDTSPDQPSTSVTFADYSIRLTTTTRTVAQLSSNFATNLGGASVLVREGALTIPAFSFPHRPTSDVGPAPFGPLISFTTPFTYTGESLLIEIRHSGNGVETTDVDVATTGGSVVNTSSLSAESGIVSSGPCIVAELQVKSP